MTDSQLLKKWQFSYGGYHNMTVTVKARTLEEADLKAREEMDRRYDERGWEPPVGWTLQLIKTTPLKEHHHG